MRGCLVVIGVFILIGYLTKGTKTNSDDVSLHADIQYKGFEILITNNDNFDYKNARLKLNESYVLEGYDIKAGSTYSVGMGQFTNSDDERFNFLLLKPKSFAIYCDVSEGRRGVFYGESR